MKTRIFLIGFILTIFLTGCPTENPPVNSDNNNQNTPNNNDSTGLDELGKDSLCYAMEDSIRKSDSIFNYIPISYLDSLLGDTIDKELKYYSGTDTITLYYKADIAPGWLDKTYYYTRQIDVTKIILEDTSSYYAYCRDILMGGYSLENEYFHIEYYLYFEAYIYQPEKSIWYNWAALVNNKDYEIFIMQDNIDNIQETVCPRQRDFYIDGEFLMQYIVGKGIYKFVDETGKIWTLVE
ncbi:MAG: hypothetical protein ACI3ZZ_06655 [Candidatus Aphodosoma sp.]